MRQMFYTWLFKRFYKRVTTVEKKYFGNSSYATNQCIKLRKIMNYLKEELTGQIK